MKKYLSLVKFAHTLFALPFAMVGFTLGIIKSSALADGGAVVDNWWVLLLQVLICMVTARNAAMSFNRYLDRDIDALNPRTATREIPAGVISTTSAVRFIAINCLIFVVAAFSINTLCGILAPVALIVLLGYSYMKRVSALCHFVLGLALGIAPVGAYVAVTGTINIAVILLAVIVMLWTGAFDILYSLQDEEFDRENKLHSIPELIGRRYAMIFSTVVHIAIIPLLFLFYVNIVDVIKSETLFFIGAAIFTALLIWQHLIISPNNLKRLNAAFFTTNGAASLIFALFTILSLLISF